MQFLVVSDCIMLMRCDIKTNWNLITRIFPPFWQFSYFIMRSHWLLMEFDFGFTIFKRNALFNKNLEDNKPPKVEMSKAT